MFHTIKTSPEQYSKFEFRNSELQPVRITKVKFII